MNSNNKKNFVIPQVEDETNEKVVESNLDNKQKEKYKGEAFASPFFGTFVNDKDYYPSLERGNRARQYDSFRDDDKRVAKEDYSQFSVKNPYIKKKEENKPVEQTINTTPTPVQNNYIEDRVEEKYEEEYVQEDINDEDSRFEGIETVNINQAEEVHSSPYMFNKNGESQNRNSKQVSLAKQKKMNYVSPPINLLNLGSLEASKDYAGAESQKEIIDNTLKEFGVGGHVVDYTMGPTVTLFEVQLDPGVKIGTVSQLERNFQGNLKALTIRIEAPIPGKSTVGIEVPNINRSYVNLGDMINNDNYLKDGKQTTFALGINIQGSPIYPDIRKMPHCLVAGCTGTGKSVCLNAIICSILYKAHPDDVKLILIDPKTVEFSKYAGMPHLATPIITDKKLAGECLRWAIDEMNNRYQLFGTVGAAKYDEYIEIINEKKDYKHLPYIIIIIDEIGDLLKYSPDIPESIFTLTSLARAAGIHLIVATQRPSAEVINGDVKNNIPTRIAFKVTNAIDSGVVLGHTGAEALLGEGDMLYDTEGQPSNRIQGAYVDAKEIRAITNYIRENNSTNYIFDTDELKHRTQVKETEDDTATDEMFEEIARYVVDMNNASINNIQKKFGCGFNRSQAIIQKLEQLGVVGENVGSRAREVLVDRDKLEEILENL